MSLICLRRVRAPASVAEYSSCHQDNKRTTIALFAWLSVHVLNVPTRVGTLEYSDGARVSCGFSAHSPLWV
jgi:hypothetical protein